MITYNPWAKSDIFFHHRMNLWAYFVWCFHCLTGRLNEYEIRFGLLDYLFVLPALLKGLVPFADYLKRSPSGLWLGLFGVGCAAITYFTVLLPLIYLTALVLTAVLSPVLLLHRRYSLKTWDRHIKAIGDLEIYIHPYDASLEEYDFHQEHLLQLLGDDLLQKTTINQSNLYFLSFDMFHPIVRQNGENKEELLIGFHYSSKLQGIIVPHQGTSEGIRAIMQWDDGALSRKSIGFKMEPQLNQPNPMELVKNKKQFEAFFSLTQAFRTAALDQPNANRIGPTDGLITMANGKVPETLFNQLIAPLAGLNPLSDTSLMSHTLLEDCFMSRNLFFIYPADEQSSAGSLNSMQPTN